MKTSVVIPATNGNFGYLNCILRHYEDGSVRPDEVVISISNAHLLDGAEIDKLENKFGKSFIVNILRHDQKMIQGPNRDAATMEATGDIIISNDADDMPHPRRVEIIQGMFERHGIVHLNHAYQKIYNRTRPTCKAVVHKNNEFNEVAQIQSIKGDEVFKHHFPNCNIPNQEERKKALQSKTRPNPHILGFDKPYGGGLQWEIHAGCPTFRRDVFQTLRWRNTEEVAWDYDFCMDVLYYFNKSMIIDTPLIWYNLLPTRRDHADPSDLQALYKE